MAELVGAGAAVGGAAIGVGNFMQVMNNPPPGPYQVIGTCDNCGGPVLRRGALLLKSSDAKCGKCGWHPKFDGEYGPVLAMVD